MSETLNIPAKAQFIQVGTSPSGYRWEGSDEPIQYSGWMNVMGDDQHVLTADLVAYYNGLYGTNQLVIDAAGVVKTNDGIVLGNIGEQVSTRYVANSTEIWKPIQDKRGISPTTKNAPGWPKDVPAPGDEVFMQDGNIWVDSKVNKKDKGLWLWLNMHNQNESFPFRDNSFAFATFKLNDTRQKAMNSIEREDIKETARQIIYELKDGKKFNTEKLNWFKKLFRNDLGHYDTDEEVFLGLLQIKERDPESIINTVESGRTDYTATIQQALDLNILTRGRGNIVNSKTGNVVITLKPGAGQGDILEKLTNHYISKDGEAEFDQLKNIVTAQKQNI